MVCSNGFRGVCEPAVKTKRTKLTLMVSCVALLAPGCGFQRAMQTAMREAMQARLDALPLTIYLGGTPSPQIALSVPIPFLPLSAGCDRQRPMETLSIIEIVFF